MQGQEYVILGKIREVFCKKYCRDFRRAGAVLSERRRESRHDIGSVAGGVRRCVRRFGALETALNSLIQ